MLLKGMSNMESNKIMTKKKKKKLEKKAESI